MIKFGIISFAHMHANGYAHVLSELAKEGIVEFVGIADTDLDRAKTASQEFDSRLVFGDYREMLTGDVVDAVIICSENSRHANEVVDCVMARKHVLCEKPIGISQSDIVIMERTLKSKSIVFHTAFVCRFSPSVVEAKRAIDSGELGAVKAISATNHGRYPGGWFGDKNMAGGGAIIDHTVHAADVIRFLTGDEFGSVRAFRGANIRGRVNVEDNALIYARLQKSNVPVSIDCSWSRHDTWPTWGDLTLNLFCEKGVLKIDAFRPHIQLANANGYTWHGLGEDLNEKLVRSFIHAILEKDGVRVPEARRTTCDRLDLRAGFDDGARAAEVAFAAYQSIAQNNGLVQTTNPV